MTGATADCYRVTRHDGATASHEGEAESQRSAKADGHGSGHQVLSYLIGGVLLYGFLGWLGDHFLRHAVPAADGHHARRGVWLCT